MPIINKTKDSVLADSFEECTSFWQQTRGMMFRKEVVPLVFVFPREKIIKLHSWFCPGNMDLIFLDESWEVVELQHDWSTRSTYTPQRPFMFLLELPSGTIFRTGTQVGDVLHILK